MEGKMKMSRGSSQIFEVHLRTLGWNSSSSKKKIFPEPLIAKWKDQSKAWSPQSSGGSGGAWTFGLGGRGGIDWNTLGGSSCRKKEGKRFMMSQGGGETSHGFG